MFFKRIFQWRKDEFFKKLLKNSFVLFSGDAGASTVSTVSIFLIVRSLGAENYGILILIQNYVSIFDRLFNFQAWQGVIKFGAETIKTKKESELKKVIKNGFIFDILSALLGGGAALLLGNIVGSFFEWHSEIIHLTKIFSISIFFHIAGTPKGVLRLFDEFNKYAYVRIGSSLIKLVGVIFAMVFFPTLPGFVYSLLLVNILGYLLLVFVTFKVIIDKGFCDFFKYKINNWRPFFNFSFWTNISSSLDLPIKKFDVYIVSAILSYEIVGVYGLFKQISEVISKISLPVYQAVYPQLALKVAKKETIEAVKIVGKIGVYLFLICAPLILLISFTSPWWLKWFFGEIFSFYWHSLFLFLSIKLISVVFVGVHPLLISMGLVKEKVIVMAISNGLFLTTAYIFGKAYGLPGVLLGVGLQITTTIFLKGLFIFGNIKRKTF